MKKISAISSRTHGDARKAVELLSKSAQIAERQGKGITLELVDKALVVNRIHAIAAARAGTRLVQTKRGNCRNHIAVGGIIAHEDRAAGVTKAGTALAVPLARVVGEIVFSC